MPTFTELTDSIRDQIIETIKDSEERSLAAVSSVNSVVDKLLPVVTKVEDAGVNLFPFARSLPVVSSLPKPSDVIAANTAFVERLVKAQTAFAVTVLDREPAAHAPAAKKAAATKA
jgi:hypothetical protein